eukprot:COSAG01_NODE_3575_length_5917_cov_239.201100_2_plen_305_part_00
MDDPGPTRRRRQRHERHQQSVAVQALMLCQVCRSFGIMVRMQTETQIWLNHFAGDFSRQALVQGNVESVAGMLGFVITPILGGLSDAIGRRPLMIMSPCISVLTNIMIVCYPTVYSLSVRRLLMPLSSTPWHSGEAAALADMFKGDAAGFGLAKSRIDIMMSISMIICPVIGARLAAVSLRLPWAVCGVAFTTMAILSYLFLQETLPTDGARRSPNQGLAYLHAASVSARPVRTVVTVVAMSAAGGGRRAVAVAVVISLERVPFRFRGSSSHPLSFLKLFRSGRKMRLLALSQMWSSVSGRFST